LDITVHQSDTRRRAGHLSRQDSSALRWAAFEAAQSAARPSSPDHDFYLQLKDRLGANRVALTIARKLLRRAHHTLRELGDAALVPPPDRDGRACLTISDRPWPAPPELPSPRHADKRP
jgi:transposase